jgi:hypothetical protein
MTESTTMTRVHSLAMHSLHMSTAQMPESRHAPQNGPTSSIHVNGAEQVADNVTRALSKRGNFYFLKSQSGNFWPQLDVTLWGWKLAAPAKCLD